MCKSSAKSTLAGWNLFKFMLVSQPFLCLMFFLGSLLFLLVNSPDCCSQASLCRRFGASKTSLWIALFGCCKIQPLHWGRKGKPFFPRSRGQICHLPNGPVGPWTAVIAITSGNRTWQWTIPINQTLFSFFSHKSIFRTFPIAMFNCWKVSVYPVSGAHFAVSLQESVGNVLHAAMRRQSADFATGRSNAPPVAQLRFGFTLW